jgi:serine/threonine protein kinase
MPADTPADPPHPFAAALETPQGRPPLESGARIGSYVIQSVLGEGGVARVYLATHAEEGGEYALKVLNSSSASLRDRMLREGRLQARLDHRNIVRVHAVLNPPDGEHPPALVLEYINGKDLETLVRSRRLSIDEVEMIATGLFRAVRYAHAHGLVHRDLKPANILLSFEGERIVPKVADFGLVKDVHGESSTQLGIALGTPRYMSPEQIRDSGSVDVRSDVFALGAVLSFMLTGRNAFGHGVDDVVQVFTAIMEADIDAHIEAIAAERPDTPQRMLDAVRGALTRDRTQRLARVSALSAVFSGRETLDTATPAPSDGTLSTEGEEPISNLDHTLDPEPAEHPAPPSAWLPDDPRARWAVGAIALLVCLGLVGLAASLF